MSTLTPSQLLDLTFKTMDVRFREGYASVKNLMVDRVAMATNSTGESVKYGWPDLLPQVREWLGERVIHNVSARQQEIINKTWELSLAVERTKLADQQVTLYGPMAEMTGRELAVFWDKRLTVAIEAATSTLCFDGQAFFSTAHPIDPDGQTTTATQSNLLGTHTLNTANYADALAKGKLLKGRDNLPLGMFQDPANVVMMVHPDEELEARQVLNAEFIAVAAGQNAAQAQTNVLQNSAQLVVNPYMTGTAGDWYLFDTSRPIKPFIKQLREGPEFVQMTANTDPEVFNHDRYVYGARFRGEVGIGLYFMALKMTVA